MNTAVFVLLVVFGSSGSTRPPTTMAAEFSSAETCNATLVYWRGVTHNEARFIAGGCFKK